MKRFFGILLAMIMMASYAVAETDLSSMSFDDLVELQKAITREIMTRPEWKEVRVPAGDWKIGEDIPEGAYSIKADSSIAMIDVWAKEKGDYNNFITSNVITPDAPVGKIELKNGWTISIAYTVIFSPFISLGF